MLERFINKQLITINEMEIESRILSTVTKHIGERPTVTSLSQDIGLSRVGTWKILKKLEASRLITMKKISQGKTNAAIISLDWENPLTEKHLEIALIEEAIYQKRWQDTFKELETITDLTLIFGSVLSAPAQANDIDVLNIGAKERFVQLDQALARIQVTQAKRIHATNLTKEELIAELKKPNIAIVEAMRGVVLFGTGEYIRIMRSLDG
jgi:hypothetical protein